ncbi:MAG: type II toxin-antitoxin system VapC family toxin [Nitrososphaera sp.]
MKKLVYFDTSAVIKEFVPEVGSDLVDDVSNAARAGKLKVIMSIWSVNEAVAVIDRLTRRPAEPLSPSERQQIIATFVERIKDSNEKASFRITPIEHILVTQSRLLIDQLHISPDDALHLYTAWIYDCDYFFIHDNKIVNRLKAASIQGMKIIDLADERDRALARQELSL